MKLLLSSIFSTLLLFPFSEAQVDLTARWKIDDVVATIDGNKFSFQYPSTSKSWLTDDGGAVIDKVQVTMYDFDCKPKSTTIGNQETYGKIGIDGFNYVESSSPFRMDSLDYSGDDLEFVFTTKPSNMAKISEITSTSKEENVATSAMKFCVRVGLIAVDSEDPGQNIEINFQETEVTLSVTMDGGFSITKFGVAPKEKTSDSASQTYKVVAQLCTANQGQAPKVDDKFNQGAAIKVCITPDAQAEKDGVVMTSVDSFTWSRTYESVGDETPLITTQNAIIGTNTESLDGLTQLTPQDDKKMIVVTSVLFAKFYETGGDVSAAGAATMAFPSATGTAAAAADAVAATVAATNTDAIDAATATAAAAAAVVVWNAADSEHVSEPCSTLCSIPGNRREPVPQSVNIENAINSYINQRGEQGSASTLYGDVINCWDVSQRTTITYAFADESSNFELYCWDTSSVTSLAYTFSNNPTFNQDVSMWDVSKVKDFTGVFFYAAQFNQKMCNWSASILASTTTSNIFMNSKCPEGGSPPTSISVCRSDCDQTRRLGSSSSSRNDNNNVINNNNKMDQSKKRNLQEGGSSENDAIVAPFEMTASVNKADDGPVALQQTAGGTGTSITVVTTTIVGLVSAILLV